MFDLAKGFAAEGMPAYVEGPAQGVRKREEWLHGDEAPKLRRSKLSSTKYFGWSPAAPQPQLPWENSTERRTVRFRHSEEPGGRERLRKEGRKSQDRANLDRPEIQPTSGAEPYHLPNAYLGSPRCHLTCGLGPPFLTKLGQKIVETTKMWAKEVKYCRSYAVELFALYGVARSI